MDIIWKNRKYPEKEKNNIKTILQIDINIHILSQISVYSVNRNIKIKY
jgi:hypothetical protein